MDDINRWEDEGGAPRVVTRGRMLSFLRMVYPKIVYSEMDGAIFWKSLTPYNTGDTLVHEGTTYRVLYGWQWTEYESFSGMKPIPVYMAELEVVQ